MQLQEFEFFMPVSRHSCNWIRSYDFSHPTDFEPIVAWAAKNVRVFPCIGLGHQYAFKYDIRRYKKNVVAQWICQNLHPRIRNRRSTGITCLSYSTSSIHAQK